MLKYIIPAHFTVRELVPKAVYDRLGNRAILVMDSRILETVDAVRKFFGVAITINDWSWGGNRQYSGFRPADCGIGAEFSQHKYGRAVDCLVKGVPAEEARTAILINQKRFPHITVMEKNVSWLHLDCRACARAEITMINP